MLFKFLYKVLNRHACFETLGRDANLTKTSKQATFFFLSKLTLRICFKYTGILPSMRKSFKTSSKSSGIRLVTLHSNRNLLPKLISFSLVTHLTLHRNVFSAKDWKAFLCSAVPYLHTTETKYQLIKIKYI